MKQPPIPKAWIRHFQTMEGSVDHFYLDGAGMVTIGIGCVVYEPLQLPMVHRLDLHAATAPEIMRDFHAVAQMESGLPLSQYKQVCCLLLPENHILRLFRFRLRQFLQEIHDSIVDLSFYPEPASLALVDMAFNLGAHGLKTKFPKFLTAFLAKDWPACAKECERRGVQPRRNAWTRQTFLQLPTT